MGNERDGVPAAHTPHTDGMERKEIYGKHDLVEERRKRMVKRMREARRVERDPSLDHCKRRSNCYDRTPNVSISHTSQLDDRETRRIFFCFVSELRLYTPLMTVLTIRTASFSILLLLYAAL